MSSKTFPSTGEPKPKFDPNAAYEAVQDTPVPKGNKPAFNPNKKFEVVQEAEEQKQVPEKTATQQPEFKPMTDWLNVPQAAQPIVPGNEVNDHTIKTAKSAERVKLHLQDIDNSVINLIHDRKKDIQGKEQSEALGINPSEAGPVNFQAQQLAQKDKRDVYVSPVEVQTFKEKMAQNPQLAREALAQKAKDLADKNPVEANTLKGDIYQLDRQNDPHKDKKITENIDKINKGYLDYDIKHGVLTKPVGFWGGIVEGFKQKGQAFDDYGVYSTGSESDIIKHLNKKLIADPDEPTVVGKEGFANVIPGGEAGMMVGGQPIKPLAGGALAGWIGGPQAGAAAMSLISGPEMYKLGYANSLPQSYAAIKKENPNISDVDAYHKAAELADKQASVDAATGIAMGALGGEFAFKPTGLGAGLLQKSIGSALTQIGEAGAKKTLEGLGVGAFGAAGQVVKNLMAQKAGLPTETTAGVADQFKFGVQMTLAMTLAAKAPELLKPKTYNQLFQGISKEPPAVIDATLNDLQQSGHITPEEAQQVQTAIKEHKAIDQSIRGDVPESERLKIQEKIKQRDAKKKELETAHDAYHPEIKEEIKKLDKDILDLSKGSDRGELQQLVDKEHKGGKLQGFVTETLRNASEGDLKRYFKEISEQAHDPNSEATTIETFGENIVNKAKELYPKEEPKQSSISVIQPGEIKHPETRTIAPREQPKDIQSTENVSVIMPKGRESEPITIKPQDNATLSIGKSEEVPLGETPGDSQPMGEGIPESGETPGTQEPASPKEESINPGKEGQVSEPEMIGITHAEMDKVSRELGLPEYTQDPETFESWTREAKDRIAKDPDAINKLINKLRKGEAPDPVETQMMKMHFAALKDRYNHSPTPELLAEINRTKDLYNISGRQLGKELVARKGLVPEEDSLADFHMRDVEFNKGAPLTEEQTAQSTKEFHEIKAAKDALEEKVAKMEAEKAKEKAQKELDKISKATKKGEPRDYKAEREKILADMKKKWEASKWNTNVTIIPYADRLFKIAPDAAKLIKLLVEEGIDKLPDLVKAAHDHLKNFIPEITEKDVHDIIAGEYNDKKPGKNQLQEKIFDLKAQAKLINKLESLQAGVQPKSPKQRRVRGQEIEALKQQVKDLEGTQGRTDAEKLASLKGRYKTKIAEIEAKIKKGDFGPDEKPEPIELDKEGQELKDRYIEAKKERELRLAKQEYEDRPLKQRAADLALGILDLRRMVGTAFDFSVPFRQALPVTINPLKIKTTALAFKNMFSHFYSAKNLDRWWFDLEKSADYKEMLDDGVPIHSPDDLRISKREEEFRTKLAEKIPVVGAGVKMSNRAASGYLNSMRVDLYRKGREVLEAKGITRANSPKVYEALGNDIANLTGSGKLLPFLEGKPAKALGSVFFGARLMAAKFNLLNPITYGRMPKPIMIRALRDLAIRTGMYVTAGYLAKAAGLSVSLDPNDKDFMKIKHGETTYDITGGEAIYIRTFLRVLGAAHERITGEEKSSLKTAEKAGDSFKSFFRNKLAPTPAYVIDAFYGKKATGEKFDPYDIVRVYPMWIDDIVDDWHQDKAGSILTAAIPSIFGIGVMTIPPKEGGGSGGGAGATGKYTKTTKQNKQGKPHKTHR
jgi:hypothetical protein